MGSVSHGGRLVANSVRSRLVYERTSCLPAAAGLTQTELLRIGASGGGGHSCSVELPIRKGFSSRPRWQELLQPPSSPYRFGSISMLAESLAFLESNGKAICC